MTERKQVLDDGYRAVAFEVGDSLEKAMKENAELKGRLELWRKSEEGTLAQMAETNERFEGALSTIRELEAQLAEANANIESLDAALENSAAEGILWIEKTARAEMRAEAAEAQLAEAKAQLRDWVENRGPRLTAEEVNRQLAGTGERINTLTSALEKCITQRNEADYRTGQAEARAAAMRKALEMVEWGSDPDDPDGRCPCCLQAKLWSSGKPWGHTSGCFIGKALTPTPAESEVKE
jgi:DNA repair exonuclease SbcCD ATPase subunit